MIITTARGFRILVDDGADYELVKDFKWYGAKNTDVTARYYAVTNIVFPQFKDKRAVRTMAVWMHQMLMKTPKGMIVDHINGNTLDNRRSNLRLCTVRENNQNRCASFLNKAGYKGIFPSRNKWEARITLDGIRYYLGRFATKEDAALAYEAKAAELFGEFYRPQVIPASVLVPDLVTA